MRIRLTTSRSGIAGVQTAGAEIDVPQAEAIRMIKAGQAVPVRAAPEPEKAVSAAPRGRAKGRAPK